MKYIIFALFFINISLFSQPISATISTDSSRILIGNPLTLRLTIEAEATVKFNLPTLQDSFGKWEVLQRSPVVKGNEKGRNVFSQNIVLTAWDSGRYEIPAILIPYQNGQDSAQIQTNPLAIQVLTINVDTTQAIKPIKTALPAAYMWQEAIPYMVLVGLMAILGLVYFFYKKWKKQQKQQIVPLAPRPKALKLLEDLEKKEPSELQELRDFYAGISYILRDYLSKTKGFSAYEMVTSEVIEALTHNAAANEVLEIKHLLLQCDKVKFANYEPTQAENRSVLQEAKDWIIKY